jgi:hypothetical protein
MHALKAVYPNPENLVKCFECVYGSNFLKAIIQKEYEQLQYSTSNFKSLFSTFIFDCNKSMTSFKNDMDKAIRGKLIEHNACIEAALDNSKISLLETKAFEIKDGLLCISKPAVHKPIIEGQLILHDKYLIWLFVYI